MSQSASKRPRTAPAAPKPNDAESEGYVRGSMVVLFESMDGQVAGPQLDLPLDSTTHQMEQVVNKLLSQQEEAVPYAFYLAETGDAEMIGTLRDVVERHGLSTERVLRIKFHPLSLFKVHPVTRCTESMPGHTDAILHVTFSPDGQRLASGGGDATVRFWDVHTCTPQHVCRGHKHHVLCTAWSPDGNRFASGDKSGELRLWDSGRGESVGKPLKGHRMWITSLSWEPLHRNSKCVRLLSGSKDRTARIWNVRTGRSEATLTGHGDSVECVRWGGEGLVYTASRDRNVMVWRVLGGASTGERTTIKLVRTLKGHSHRVNSLALSTDYLCRTGAFDAGAEVLARRHGMAASAAARNAPLSGEAAAEAAAVRYAEARRKAGNDSLEDTSFDDAETDKISSEGVVPFERLVSCSDDFTVFLWHPTLHKRPVQRLTGHVQAVTHLKFSPDGRYLASASFDRKVKLWDGRTGRFIATLSGHVAHVYQVSWSPDSRMLCSASKDSTLKVWEAAKCVGKFAKPRFTLSGHMDEVYALDWSPNGKMLASGSKDRLVKIWRH